MDGIKLATLTNEKIEEWRIDFIRRKATDPLKEKSARISASSFILRARSLFSAETVARIRDIAEIPEPLPFSGIKAETVRVSRYRSSFDLAELLESAREELAAPRPEEYKIFLLGALAGLRRNEIDVLPWTAFRFDEGVIRIETTEFYRPKSHNSEADVRVDPELLEVFQGYYARRKGGFVIESDSPPPPFDAPYGVYRCRPTCGRSWAGFAARASSRKRRSTVCESSSAARSMRATDCLPPASSYVTAASE